MSDLSVPANQAKLDAVRRLAGLAAQAGLPLSHLATAFVRAHPAVTSVIIGPRRPEHLADLLAAADVTLGEDVLDATGQVSRPAVQPPWPRRRAAYRR